MSRNFGPSSKGPRNVASVSPYDMIVESLHKTSRTGRIRLRPGLAKHGDELLIEKWKVFTQTAVRPAGERWIDDKPSRNKDGSMSFRHRSISNQIRVREEMPRKFVDAKGRTCWSPIPPVADQRYTGFTRGRPDTSGNPGDVTLRAVHRSGDVKCTCGLAKQLHTGMVSSVGAITKSVTDRRGCPMHDASLRPAFRRLVCGVCGTSFVPQHRYQDCCQKCWGIGETPAARLFGPASLTGR